SCDRNRPWSISSSAWRSQRLSERSDAEIWDRHNENAPIRSCRWLRSPARFRYSTAFGRHFGSDHDGFRKRQSGGEPILPQRRAMTQNFSVGMSRHQLGDPQFEYGDPTAQRRHPGHRGARTHGRRFHYRGVLGRRCGLVNALDAFLNPLLGAAVVRVEELAQGAGMGVLQLLQSRPAWEQIGDQGAVQVVEPVQNLREVQLQGSGETMAVAGFLVYQLAAFFYQEMQQAGLLGIRLQGAQRLTMAHQQIQQRSRVMGIAVGA